MNFVSQNKLIILILSITLLKGVIWSYATPLFQAPDEQVHYASVQYYAEPAGYEPKSYDFPLDKTDMFNLRTQNLSPELKYFLEKTQFEKVRFHKEKTMDFRSGAMDGSYENDVRQSTSSRFVEKYPAWVIHYSAPYYLTVAGIENLFGNFSIIERVYLERLFSVFLLALFVLFSYLMFRELGQNEVISALLAGAVSFQPMLTFITSSINIDTLLIAAFGALLYGAIRFLKRGAEPVSIVWIVGGSIVSFFTKPPGYFALAVILLLLVLFFLRQAKIHLQINPRQKIFLYTGFTVLILVLGGLFLLLYQSAKSRYFPGSQPLGLLPDYVRHQLEYYVLYAHSSYYWGNFGWLDTPFPQVLIWMIWACLVGGFIGLIYYFAKNLAGWKALKERKKIFFYQVIFLLLAFLGFGFMIHAVNFQQVNPNNVADETNSIAIQGRYFFPVMGAKFFLIFWGWAAITTAIYKRTKPGMAALLLFSGLVLLNLTGLLAYLVPRYYLNDKTAYFSQELLDRMSQYKPILFKEWVIIFVFIVFLVFTTQFLYVAICRSFRRS